MKRLTEKRDGQNVIPLRQDGKLKWALCSAGMGDAPTQFLYGAHADKLAKYEDLQDKLNKQFDGCIEMDTVIDSIIEYDKQLGRGEKLAKAMMITNDSVRKFREWKELDEQGKLYGKWIPCSEKLPENEKEVEITFVRKHYRTGETLYLTARAFHEDGTLTTDDSIFCWEEGADWEYVEEKDGYIIPEGWFEGVSFTENFGIVDMSVIAWRSISEPYRPQVS